MPITLTQVSVPEPLSQKMMPLAPVSVPAGFPSPAADDLEDQIDPIAHVVRNEPTTYWWKVDGHSLKGIGILDKDILAVDRGGVRKLGRVVVAVVDGELTVKILGRKDHGLSAEYWLYPANDDEEYKPLRMTEGSEIWGVVAGLVRRYDID